MHARTHTHTLHNVTNWLYISSKKVRGDSLKPSRFWGKNHVQLDGALCESRQCCCPEPLAVTPWGLWCSSMLPHEPYSQQPHNCYPMRPLQHSASPPRVEEVEYTPGHSFHSREKSLCVTPHVCAHRTALRLWGHPPRESRKGRSR